MRLSQALCHKNVKMWIELLEHFIFGVSYRNNKHQIKSEFRKKAIKNSEKRRLKVPKKAEYTLIKRKIWDILLKMEVTDYELGRGSV